MICEHCGNENAQGNSYCGACGGALTAQATAEHRQITVLFCDMVGSTELSGQLDPEDLQELIGVYYGICDRAVSRYGGHIAQYLGDGVLVYFGFPRVHEDDPIRALRAALGILEEIAVERPAIEERWDCTLSVRIGVHTGPVVVGEMGVGDGRQQLALGETTNIAARLQAFAVPNGIVASQTTLALARGNFRTKKLEGLSLRGVSQPMDGAEVEAYAPAARYAGDHSSPIPLVGRSKEYAELVGALERSREGFGATVLVTGEPGIGKSRLVDELREIQFEPSTEGWLTLQCVAHDATRPFGPVIEALRRALSDETHPLDTERLREALIAAGDTSGVGIELLAQHFGFAVPLVQTAKWLSELRRRRTIEWFSRLLYGYLGKGPGILVVEDLHWADTSTLDLVTDLGDRTPELPRLLVLTARPEFSGAYDAPRGFTHLVLDGLSEEATGELIHHVAQGRKFAPELVRTVAERSDGVPLFTEQVARNLLERGDNLDRGPSLTTVPGTLHDLLNARLDRLGEAREVAQRLSVLGRSFTPAAIEWVCADISELPSKLLNLEDADLLVRANGTLSFKHALVQEAAYQTLLRRDRRRIHKQCAAVFAEDSDGIALDQPSLIAHHWTEAGETVNAINAWLAAATHARDRGALNEANNAIDRGLALLDGIEDPTVRDDRELELRNSLNTVLIGKGGPATEAFLENNLRGLELVRHAHDPRNVFLRMAIGMSHMIHSRLDEAEAVCEEGLAFAKKLHQPILQGYCHSTRMRIAVYRGDLKAAFLHTELADAVWPADSPHMTGPAVATIPVDSALFRSLALWHSGSPDAALAESKRALELAHCEKTPSGSEAWVGVYGSWLRILRGEHSSALEIAEAGLEASNEIGASTLVSSFQQAIAWAKCELESSATTARSLELLSTRAFDSGRRLTVAYSYALAGSTYGRCGQPERGLELANRAVEIAETLGEHYAYPEILRVRTQLRHDAGGSKEQAIAGCEQALAVAETLGMRSWGLRIATDLARLHGANREAARGVLEPVYASFSEGHETRDLRTARAVLESVG